MDVGLLCGGRALIMSWRCKYVMLSIHKIGSLLPGLAGAMKIFLYSLLSVYLIEYMDRPPSPVPSPPNSPTPAKQPTTSTRPHSACPFGRAASFSHAAAAGTRRSRSRTSLLRLVSCSIMEWLRSTSPYIYTMAQASIFKDHLTSILDGLLGFGINDPRWYRS